MVRGKTAPWRRVVLAGAILAPLVGSAVAAQARPAPGTPGACSSGNVQPFGKWTEIETPPFPDNDPVDTDPLAISTFAVDPTTPGRLFVTDGVVVMRSTDYGCTWRTVFTLGAPPSVSTSSTHNVVNVVATGKNHVYITTQVGYIYYVSQVFASSNGGASFAESDSGLPPDLQIRSGGLVAAPSNPKRLYLMAGSPALYGMALYVSNDAGKTWTLQPAVTPAFGDASTGYVAVDPIDPDHIYVWYSGSTLFRSTDAGKTLTPVPTLTSVITSAQGTGLTVIHDRGSAPRLLWSDGSSIYDCNADCSQYFARPDGPASVVDVNVVRSRSTMFTYGTGGVITRWNYRTGRMTTLTPYSGLLGQVELDGKGAVYVSTQADLYRYAGG